MTSQFPNLAFVRSVSTKFTRKGDASLATRDHEVVQAQAELGEKKATTVYITRGSRPQPDMALERAERPKFDYIIDFLSEMRLRIWAEPGPALGTSVAVQIALISNAPIALRRPRTSNIIRPGTTAAMYHTAVPRYRHSWITQRLSHYTTPLLHATIVLQRLASSRFSCTDLLQRR